MSSSNHHLLMSRLNQTRKINVGPVTRFWMFAEPIIDNETTIDNWYVDKLPVGVTYIVLCIVRHTKTKGPFIQGYLELSVARTERWLYHHVSATAGFKLRRVSSLVASAMCKRYDDYYGLGFMELGRRITPRYELPSIIQQLFNYLVTNAPY